MGTLGTRKPTSRRAHPSLFVTLPLKEISLVKKFMNKERLVPNAEINMYVKDKWMENQDHCVLKLNQC